METNLVFFVQCQFYKKGDGFGKRNEMPAANSTPSKVYNYIIYQIK